MISFLCRCILNVAILYFVWRNAHWSVALLLTMCDVRFEIEDTLYPKVRK